MVNFRLLSIEAAPLVCSILSSFLIEHVAPVLVTSLIIWIFVCASNQSEKMRETEANAELWELEQKYKEQERLELEELEKWCETHERNKLSKRNKYVKRELKAARKEAWKLKNNNHQDLE